MLLAPKPYAADEIETIDRRIRRTCHPKQRGFVFDDAPRVSLVTGRGVGKTAGELMRMVRRMVRTVGANCLYIAATRESAERLAWADLKKIITLNLRLSGAKWNESKLTCVLPNGSTLYLFGCDDKSDINKLRGITYHEVGIDETASIKRELLHELLVEVIGPRMIGTIALLGTPGKILEGLFYEATAPAMSGATHRPWIDRDRPEFAGWDKWSSHSWNIRDAVDAGIEAIEAIYAAQLAEKARQGWSDSSPYFLREYLGVWAQDSSQMVYAFRPFDDAGKPHNVWTPELDAHGFAVLPDGKEWGYGIGIDVGFSDAFALEIFAWSYSDPGRKLWHVYEVYRPKLYARAIAQLLIGEHLDHGNYGGITGRIGWPDVMVGDFAGRGGDLLAELQTVYGITVKAADKPIKYKENSIELCNSDLWDGRVKILRGSKLAEEMSQLQWTVDQWGKRTENKAQPNHACDAFVYLRNAVSPMLPGAVASEPPKATPQATSTPRPRDPDPEWMPEPAPREPDADSMYNPGEW